MAQHTFSSSFPFLPQYIFTKEVVSLRWRKRAFIYRKRPLPLRYAALISVVIFILLTIQALVIIDKQIRPTIMHIATMETFKIATSAINYAVKNAIQTIDTNKLVVIEKNENDEITSISFDTNVYNEVVTQSVATAHHFLHLLEEGRMEEIGIQHLPYRKSDSEGMFEIPLGRVTNHSLLAQLGPGVPVKFASIGDVNVQLNEKIEHIGINNAWITVSMDLEVQARVIIPFASDIGVVKTTVPVGMVYVPGKVPNFYSGKEGDGFTPAIITDE